MGLLTLYVSISLQYNDIYHTQQVGTAHGASLSAYARRLSLPLHASHIPSAASFDAPVAVLAALHESG